MSDNHDLRTAYMNKIKEQLILWNDNVEYQTPENVVKMFVDLGKLVGLFGGLFPRLLAEIDEKLEDMKTSSKYQHIFSICEREIYPDRYSGLPRSSKRVCRRVDRLNL